VYFDMTLGTAPEDASALNGKGSLAAIEGKYDEAIEYAEKAQAHEPKYVAALFDLTQVYYHKAQSLPDGPEKIQCLIQALSYYTRLEELQADPEAEVLSLPSWGLLQDPRGSDGRGGESAVGLGG
jgi:tetratricopeptide (TPR) repeat protein